MDADPRTRRGDYFLGFHKVLYFTLPRVRAVGYMRIFRLEMVGWVVELRVDEGRNGLLRWVDGDGGVRKYSIIVSYTIDSDCYLLRGEYVGETPNLWCYSFARITV